MSIAFLLSIALVLTFSINAMESEINSKKFTVGSETKTIALHCRDALCMPSALFNAVHVYTFDEQSHLLTYHGQFKEVQTQDPRNLLKWKLMAAKPEEHTYIADKSSVILGVGQQKRAEELLYEWLASKEGAKLRKKSRFFPR